MGDQKVLVVEDDEDIQELVRYTLDQEGFAVTGVETGEEALKAARSVHPDLIVLDLMLPGLDGFSVCRRLKASPGTRETPVVILTAKDGEADIVRGLESGADDYVTKPFSPKVLTARIRAVLRRRGRTAVDDDEPIEIHGISIHPGRHEVSIGHDPVSLTSTEFRALHYLARRPGWVFTRQQIVKAIHGEEYVVTDRSVDVMMVGLRRKLGGRGDCIETVRGVGYRVKG